MKRLHFNQDRCTVGQKPDLVGQVQHEVEQAYKINFDKSLSPASPATFSFT